jgi:hypothetical protein
MIHGRLHVFTTIELHTQDGLFSHVAFLPLKYSGYGDLNTKLCDCSLVPCKTLQYASLEFKAEICQ